MERCVSYKKKTIFETIFSQKLLVLDSLIRKRKEKKTSFRLCKIYQKLCKLIKKYWR